MLQVRRRMRRRVSVLLVALVVLVPLVLSAHRHATPGADHACAACAATHHAPMTSAAAVPTFALALIRTAAPAELPAAPVRRVQSSRGERAPPRFSPTVIA